MRYRQLRTGEIIQTTDEYYSFFNADPFNPVDDRFIPVQQCSVGKAVLDCNAKYYRRPLSGKQDEAAKQHDFLEP